MREKVLMILFVLVLGTVLTTALVSVNAYTAPFIEKNQVRKLCIGVLKSLDIACSKDDADEIFTENIVTKEVAGKKFYFAKSGDVAFEINGSGLWGPIHGIIAIGPDLGTIKGIAIIHQEETPGLGGRIAEAEFLARFSGKKIVPRLVIVPPGKASEDNEVDGITGATLSCKAFEAMLNSELKRYVALIEGR